MTDQSERKMYERVFASKYEETKHLGHDYAAIAALIRTDIKEAVRLGVLPGKVSDYSITSDSYSMGGSISVRLLNHPHLWVDCDGTVPGKEGYACHNVWCAAKGTGPGYEVHKVLSAEGREVLNTLNWLHGRYNYDGSEIQVDYFDVRYYGHADIEDAHSQSFRLDQAAKKAEARKNAAAKRELVAHLVAKHGQRIGHLRRYSYEKLVAAHERSHESPGDHEVTDLS